MTSLLVYNGLMPSWPELLFWTDMQMQFWPSITFIGRRFYSEHKLQSVITIKEVGSASWILFRHWISHSMIVFYILTWLAVFGSIYFRLFRLVVSFERHLLKMSRFMVLFFFFFFLWVGVFFFFFVWFCCSCGLMFDLERMECSGPQWSWKILNGFHLGWLMFGWKMSPYREVWGLSSDSIRDREASMLAEKVNWFGRIDWTY